MQDLEEGWTAHKAPTGHTYYYHADTKKSTYKKPLKQDLKLDGLVENQGLAKTSDQTIKVEVEHVPPVQVPTSQLSRDGLREDRPKYKIEIPTAVPWVQVTTKQGRTFYHNPTTRASHWTVPHEIQEAVEQWTIHNHETSIAPDMTPDNYPDEDAEYSFEQDQEQEEEGGGGAEQVEFDEDDIAWQLAAMEEAGQGPLELQGDYSGPDFTISEKMEIFKQMMEDCNVDPYRTWDSELLKIASEPRYLILDNTHHRKLAFEEYCIHKTKQLQQEKAIKEDPNIAFFRLVKTAAQKVGYFQDFKRKHKKDTAYKAFGNSDHDREKVFRSFIALKNASPSDQETKFRELLNSSIQDIRTDVRYHALSESHAQSLLAKFGRKS